MSAAVVLLRELAALMLTTPGSLNERLPALYEAGFPRPLPGWTRPRRWSLAAVKMWIAEPHAAMPRQGAMGALDEHRALVAQRLDDMTRRRLGRAQPAKIED
jgi:hypothetical protein